MVFYFASHVSIIINNAAETDNNLTVEHFLPFIHWQVI